MISSLATLTALIIKNTWKIVLSWLRWLRWYIVYSDYADYADIQLYVKNSFIIDYTDYVERLLLIMHSSMTTFIFKRKREIVITDYVDYPALHITVTYTGIFSRKFNVVLHVSLTERIKIIRRSINDNPRSLTIPLEGNTCIISSSILTCGNTSWQAWNA